jgi:hypothetical protein
VAEAPVFRYGLVCCLLLSRQAAHAALIVCSGGVRGFGVGFNAAWSAVRSSRLQGVGVRGVWCPAKRGSGRRPPNYSLKRTAGIVPHFQWPRAAAA